MVTTSAFQDFEQNLGFAKRLIEGGQLLERLAVGSFDITDLYRSAWVQAVSALDHWVHEEVYQRAVALVQKPSATKPRKLKEFDIPVELLDRVHHHSAPLAEAFEAQLRAALGWRSFQHPDRIKEGFALVTDTPLWAAVAEQFNFGMPPDQHVKTQDVRERLLSITDRRNRIAHGADRDPSTPIARSPISAVEVETTIIWLHRLATAILQALHSEEQPIGGRPYLLVLSDGLALRWVLENDRFAFTAAGQSKSKKLDIGDTLFMVTTRGCWGNPHQDTTRVIGTATVSGPVRDYHEPVLIAGRKFICGCPLTIENLAPIGAGAELSTLIPKLETFGDNSNYGIKLRNTLVPLTPDDALVIHDQLADTVGDPIDHVSDYVQWTA
ncbi:hypothetical protein [Nocardia wallacei]|uniref:hypothetical protein n=1 Tax=Nocardia wallacei TaxID=480035 RepID=UPI002453CA8A|nr:hypothetical protein [Nocardia wallacei]